MHGHGPSKINLASLFAPWMFAGLHNQSPLLTMVLGIFISYDKVGNEWKNVAKKVDNFKTKLQLGRCSIAKTLGLS